MAARIENLTDKPIWLRLNSGATVSIAPRSQSVELHEHEIDGNPAIQKLIGQRTIARGTAAAATAQGKASESQSKEGQSGERANESKSDGRDTQAKPARHDKQDKQPSG